MVDVTERIKAITNNYKITKKEYIETFMNICRDLKLTPTSHKETIKNGRLECAKVLNATIKKNILKMFIDADGLSLLSEWITDALDQIDENLLKELVNAIKEKLNSCGGLTVANVKKSKIGKALNSVSKSTIISKPIKTSVDELIQDWKQKFVQETPSTTSDSKKKSSTQVATSTTTATPNNGEKRKQRPEGDNVENTSTSMSPTMDTSIPMKKKVKTDDKSLTPTLGEEYSSSSTTGKKKKKVSWSSELEKVKLIEPRSAHIEENAGQNSNGVHKTVQELLNEEKSRERTLLNQQRQLKQLILSNMKNTVPGVSPLRPIIKEHKSDQIPDLSSTEASRIAAEVQKSQSKIVHESPKSPDTVPNIAEISNLLSSFNRLNPMMTNVAVTSNAGHSASSMPTSYATPSPFSTSSTLHHHTTIVSPSISPSVATTVFQQSPSYYRPQQAQVPPPPQQQPIFTPIMTNISQPPPQPPQQPPSHHPSRQPNHHHHAHNRQSNRNQQQSNKPRPPLNPPPPPQGPVEPRSFKPIKCLFYLKGNCKNGTKCGFYHEGYDIPPQEGVEEYNFEKAKYFQSLKNSTVGTSTQNNPSSNRR